MAVWLLSFLLWFQPSTLAALTFAKPEETTTQCVTLSMSDENMKHLQEISSRLDTFLNKNLNAGHQNLKKVLDAFGVDKDSAIKVDPEDSLESFLLQYQIAMHQDTKRMFFEMKQLLLERKSPDARDNADHLEMVSPLQRKRERYASTDFQFRPADCSEVLVAGNTKSGVYDIFPFRCQCSRPVKAFCDMDTDGGGWTIFLSRENMSKPINFTRNWTEYKNGFGTPGEEYWLGNEHLYTLTSTRNYILRMEAEDGFGRDIWGEWTTFKVESEENKYKLTSTHPSPESTAFDRFAYVNANFFSTFDRDNDKHGKENCAQNSKGGWWYNACHNNNPTGLHGKRDADGIRINPWSKSDATIRYATRLQLKIRPQICSSTISVATLNTHNCNFS